MTKTVFITGASSGIGRATAILFSKQGWQVIATMRNPADAGDLAELPNVHVLALDVTNLGSIARSITEARRLIGQLDVLVNNAGYGGFGAFELASDAQVQAMFAVNVFGLMNVIRAWLPHFRDQHSGLIINISSVGGLMTYPLYSVYHSTKWAVEGFSESLQFELRQMGIQVKLVEPGATKTNFNGRSQVRSTIYSLPVYAAYMTRLQAVADRTFAGAVAPETVAETVFRAATDGRGQLRYVVGNSRSRLLVRLRAILPTDWFIRLIRKTTERDEQ